MPAPLHLSRRQLLAGGAAAVGAVLLGACGGGEDDGAGSDDGGGDGGGEGTTGGLVLAQLFGGPMFVPGERVRLPFGIADADGLLPTEGSPASLRVQVLRNDGAEVGEAVEVRRHAEGLPRAYYPLVAAIPEPGFYVARTEIEGAATEMAFEIDAPADVTVVQPGAPLPPVDTPTLADAHGVDPICTSDPVCPLHEVTLTQALGEGRPLALLVASPKFCQLAICGPVLDVLLGVTAAHPEVRFLHAEVYADPGSGQLQQAAHAPVVDALGLHFEPCLVLAGADGVVVDRIDTIFDQVELEERLSLLA